MKSVRIILVVSVVLFMAVSQVSADIIRLYATQNAQLTTEPGKENTPFLDDGLTGVFSGSYVNRSIFQFELPSNLKGMEITGAKVSLFHWSHYNSGEAVIVNRLGNDNWSQADVTWTNYMAVDATNHFGISTNLGTRANISGNAYNDWSLGLDSIVSDLADGKLTLLFMFGNEANTGSPRQLMFYTNHPANPNNSSGLPNSGIVPYLELTYNQVPVPASLLLFGPGFAGLALLRRRFKK